MRKILVLLVLAAVLALGTAACGGDDSSSGSGDGTETAVQGDAVAGKAVFTSNCGGCHTLADAETSGAVGPNLDDSAPGFETVQTQVTNGGGSMPAFADKLSADEITNVAAYVSSVAGT
ncbi:MAG: c-type cytochrome [Gaiella sp.]